MKTLYVPIACFLLASLIFFGCSTNAQRTAYNALWKVEQGARIAYNAYVDEVIDGRAGTNGLPVASQAFNATQLSIRIAVASLGTNGVASPEVIRSATTLTNSISFAKGLH